MTRWVSRTMVEHGGGKMRRERLTRFRTVGTLHRLSNFSDPTVRCPSLKES